MIQDIIEYNGKTYQLSTVNLDGCFETMVFPIKDGIISGNEVYMCRVYSAGESHNAHKDVYTHPEKYLSDEAIIEYLKSKTDDYPVDDLFAVYGHINEHGDTDSWIEELFDNGAQADACCKFLNLTKSQQNVEFTMNKIKGICNEDYISLLKYLDIPE